MVGMVKMVNLRHCAKCRGDRSNHSGDMAFFRFLKTAAATISDFFKFSKF